MQNQEYWVNVYGLDEYKAYGMPHKYKHYADDALYANRNSGINAYRIHVKIKPVIRLPNGYELIKGEIYS